MLQDPPGAKQSALRLCKSILRHSWKHRDWWRWIQDATGSDLQNSQILYQLEPLRRSVGDFEKSWDYCSVLRETSRIAETTAQLCGIHRQQLRLLHGSASDLVPYSHSIGSYITTRHCSISYLSVTVTRVATSHYGMHYLHLSIYIHMDSLGADGTRAWLEKHLDTPIERP